jgi:uncharacterized protein (DUF983 family)
MMQHVASDAGTPALSGLMGHCPRCGKGRLFEGFLRVRPQCDVCKLDYSFADAGDGPAVFLIFIAGFAVAGAALLVEFAYEPPYYIHALMWGPLALLLTIGPLRPLKGLLVGLQYKFGSGEADPASRNGS